MANASFVLDTTVASLKGQLSALVPEIEPVILRLQTELFDPVSKFHLSPNSVLVFCGNKFVLGPLREQENIRDSDSGYPTNTAKCTDSPRISIWSVSRQVTEAIELVSETKSTIRNPVLIHCLFRTDCEIYVTSEETILIHWVVDLVVAVVVGCSSIHRA